MPSPDEGGDLAKDGNTVMSWCELFRGDSDVLWPQVSLLEVLTLVTLYDGCLVPSVPWVGENIL